MERGQGGESRLQNGGNRESDRALLSAVCAGIIEPEDVAHVGSSIVAALGRAFGSHGNPHLLYYNIYPHITVPILTLQYLSLH